MENKIMIQNQEIQIKEYNGKRVVTFKDVAKVHGIDFENVKRNFTNNKHHFIESQDFYLISRNEFREKFSPNEKLIGNPNVKMVLLTESGYLMAVKSLTDDLAWEVQRELINCYFRIKQETVNEEITISVMEGEKLIRCAEIMAACLEGNRPYVLNILRHIVPNIDNLEPITVTVDQSILEVPAEKDVTIVNKATRGCDRRGYGIPFDHQKFNRYLIDNNVKIYWLQTEIGCSGGCISKWRYGESKPIEFYRNKMCDIFGLPYGYFDKKKRR